MKQVWHYARWLLLPFSLLYGIGVWIYHELYRWELLRSVRFDIPIISIGNLSVGGTGKTMLVEYLLDRFSSKYQIGVMSRGYKRKTGGYRRVQPQDSAHESGDEPAQLKKKYTSAPIVVARNRSLGIPEMLGDYPNTEVVLLDDAFQHREINPGLSILLTSYHNLFTRDFLLPVGRLREWWSGYQRADMIVVTKCPSSLSQQEKEHIHQEINPLSSQSLYFSTLEYGDPYPLINQPYQFNVNSQTTVVLMAGIAHTKQLQEYVNDHFQLYSTQFYPDHYNYMLEDLWQVKQAYNNIEQEEKVILTTEKDAIRLMPHADWIRQSRLPIYCLPVKMKFFPKSQQAFDRQIDQFIQSYR